LAGTQISFLPAQSEPGFLAGLLLQPINPKAYVVNTALFTGFPIFPDALWAEFAWKLLVLNLIWVPIHLGWVWFGGAMRRLDLPHHIQRRINVAMALSMLAAVALALVSAV